MRQRELRRGGLVVGRLIFGVSDSVIGRRVSVRSCTRRFDIIVPGSRRLRKVARLVYNCVPGSRALLAPQKHSNLQGVSNVRRRVG